MSIIILLYSLEIRQNNKNMISSDTSEYFRLGVKKFRLLFKEHRKNETEKKTLLRDKIRDILGPAAAKWMTSPPPPRLALPLSRPGANKKND